MSASAVGNLGGGVVDMDEQRDTVPAVSLPKGSTSVVPLSSVCDAEDLKLLEVWQWLRECLEYIAVNEVSSEFFQSPAAKNRIAHILQLATEGGHGMLTPPHLLTFVHAVQQPIGHPAFERLTAQLGRAGMKVQTQPEDEPTAETELDVLTAWRVLGSTDAWLVGALSVHGASTAKVDLKASWTDPLDDPTPDASGLVSDPPSSRSQCRSTKCRWSVSPAASSRQMARVATSAITTPSTTSSASRRAGQSSATSPRVTSWVPIRCHVIRSVTPAITS
jgi:hypothetical protein